ncbi:flagellar FliJ family protein [Porcipelethomonas sp.]|uniref:flagellar FliJ family protein n=1 Tax=Porcipelethomonas sp. TaxID=2981675 RepID=UPI003EF1A3D2
MKKFVFSMQKMYDYKKQIMESEKNILMSLRREKNEYEQRLEDLTVTMDDIRHQSLEEVSKGTTASKLMFYSMQMDGIKREQTEVKYQINLTEMKIEKQRRKVVALSQDVSGLEKLETEQRDEYNHLATKENENSIEEFLSFKMTAE